MSPRFKRVALFGFLIAVPVVALIVLDIVAGRIANTNEIRDSTRMFRSEAAPIFLNTRHLIPRVDHRYYFGARMDPRYEGNPDSPRLFRTDKLGTIVSGGGKPFSPPDKAILFLGGSTTESNEVDEEFRFPGLVGEILTNSSSHHYYGINLGVRGNTSRDSINLLINHPVARNAETVVLMHNINDRLSLALRGNYDSRLDSPTPTGWSAVSSSLAGFTASFWDYLSHRSNLLFLFRSKILDVNPWTGEPNREGTIDEDAIDFDDARLDENAEKFKTSLQIFVGVTRAMGKRPVLLTQALGRKSTPQSAFNQITKEVALQKSVALIDLEAALDGLEHGLFLPDDIHLNSEGSRVVAKVIAEALGSNLFGISLRSSSRAELSAPPDLSVCRAPNGAPIDPSFGTRHLLIRHSGRYPVLSPDRRWLLFSRWTGKREVIELLDMTDGTSRSISSPDNGAEDRHATFFLDSDDVLKVVFGRKEDGVERLYVAFLEGKDVKPLPFPPNLSASIPASGKKGVLYFAGAPFGHDGSILGAPDLYRWHKGSVEQLTTTPWEDWRPAMDPSGRFLFHISDQGDQFDVYRLDLNSQKATKFIGTSADEWDPDVSPDGKWVVFASEASGDWDLVIAPIDAPEKAVKLTAGLANDWDPKFSPDGRAVLFASTVKGASPYIYFVCPFGEVIP